MQQSLNAIHDAARAIPQAHADREQHSPEWRYLLQTIRNADVTPGRGVELGAEGLARIYQASTAIFAVDGSESYAIQKNALLDAIAVMAKRHEFEAVIVDGCEFPAITGAHDEIWAEAE